MSLRNNDYSYLKGLWHMNLVSSLRHPLHLKPQPPAHVQLMPVNACNHHCSFCAYREDGYTSSQVFNQKDIIPTEKLLKLIDELDFYGVRGVGFTGGGEPLLHPAIIPAMDKIVSETDLRFSLVTNGSRMTREIAKSACYASWVRISIDAATDETYTRMRKAPRGDFDRACQAVVMLREEIDRAKTDCVLGVGFVVNPDNWQETERAAALAYELGADNIRISAQFSTKDTDLFAPFHNQCVEVCKNAESFSTEKFKVYNRYQTRIDDLVQKRPTYKNCHYQHFTCVVGADLNVYRCCLLAYNERGKVGNLRDSTFSTVWGDHGRLNNMLSLDARQCERCQFNGINETLDYVICPEPPRHVEFV